MTKPKQVKKTLRKYWENFFRNYAPFYIQGVGIFTEITVRIAFMPIVYCLRHITYALPTYCLHIVYERITHCLHVETGKRQQAAAPQQTVPYLAIRIFRGDQYSRPHFSRAVLITIIITAYYECTHSERKF